MTLNEQKIAQLIKNIEYYNDISDLSPYDKDLMTKSPIEIFRKNPFYYESEWL